MTINAYPLQWPLGWKRFDTSRRNRLTAKFGRARQHHGDRYIAGRALTLAEGIQRVLTELERMGIRDRQDVVISTNVPTRLDGLPRGGLGEPGDPGVAVYWQEQFGARRVMAIDLYDRVADNLAAIAATLDAMRAIERHGGAAILERAFTGFTPLPAPGAKREWWEVLGVLRTATADEARAAYRRLASDAHPDKGGSDARMAEINAAWAKAQESALP
jgi:hypothetical protein